VLEEYQKQRRQDVVLMALATEGLNRLFSNDIAVLRILRDAGLSVVDKMPILKGAFIRHAAGVGNEMPKLMKGLAI
jgi:2-octaprenyl-6-methoxyphenol hydroxylase